MIIFVSSESICRNWHRFVRIHLRNIQEYLNYRKKISTIGAGLSFLKNLFSIIRQMFLPIGFHCNINFLQNFVVFLKSDFYWTFLCLIVIPNACLCRAHASTKSPLSQINVFLSLARFKVIFFVSCSVWSYSFLFLFGLKLWDFW